MPAFDRPVASEELPREDLHRLVHSGDDDELTTLTKAADKPGDRLDVGRRG